MERMWYSSYDKCDMCGAPIKGVVPYFVDGKLKDPRYNGAWALMCDKCFFLHGAGLGCGVGQKYDGTSAKLLEGGCPEETEM